MTLTAAQAEIVKAFMTRETLPRGLVQTDQEALSALRAALIEKEARIVELNVEANRLSTEIGKADAEMKRLRESTRVSIRDAQVYKRKDSP